MASLARRRPLSLDPLIAEAKRRMRPRRLLLAAAVLVAGAGAAGTASQSRTPAGTNTAALAARWQTTQVCRDPRKGDGLALFAKPTNGNVIGNEVGSISDPMSVTMSFATASGIAQHIGPGEFQPPGTHPSPTFVPCNIAQSASGAAGTRWALQGVRHFGIRAGALGYTGGPPFDFTCVLRDARPRALAGMCVHRGNDRVGAVKVRFVIHRTASA
jgi:hypothetical protein